MHNSKSGPAPNIPFEFIISIEIINNGSKLIILIMSSVNFFIIWFQIKKNVENIKTFKNAAEFSKKFKFIKLKILNNIGNPYG